ncbi:MAG: COG3650 family protein [Stenotrophomonas sp.]
MAGLLACSQQSQSTSERVSDASPPGQTAAPVTARFPQQLQVAGTEPFWGVRVEGDVLEFTTPETLDAPRRLQAPRRLDAQGLHFNGDADGQVFALEIQHKPCSDGMSDLMHPYTAEFVLGEQTFKGCARDPAVPIEAP